MKRTKITILGSTGSIGTQTIEVIEYLNGLKTHGTFEIVGLAAGKNAKVLADQAARLGVKATALGDERAAGQGASQVPSWVGSMGWVGPDAAKRLVEAVDCDVVVSAMVGVAGLSATLRAVELGRTVALANKETLVTAGALVVEAATRSGARIVPIDSEHAGVWQALASDEGWTTPMVAGPNVKRVVLTASGGPFRTMSKEQCANATLEQALKHPNWSMGQKVTLDSATLINKAFELIEARWLFGVQRDRIGVLIHPQSVVHAIVQYVDGSMVAQLGPADMRMPILLALLGGKRGTWPSGLDVLELSSLEFARASEDRWPALNLAWHVMEEGAEKLGRGAAFNAASEVAVRAFVHGKLAFGQIVEVTHALVHRFGQRPVLSVEDVLALHQDVIAQGDEMIKSLSTGLKRLAIEADL